MGGSGSGRSWGFGRSTVEDSLTLDINKLVRDGMIRTGVWCSGNLIWRQVSTGEKTASIAYEANAKDPYGAWFRVHYRVNGELQDYRITMETTQPNYGGRRWWFRCPLTSNRVAKLHLPPGEILFGSRRQGPGDPAGRQAR